MIKQAKLHLDVTRTGAKSSTQRSCVWVIFSKKWAVGFVAVTSLQVGALAGSASTAAEQATQSPPANGATSASGPCLSEGGGFLKARLTGSIRAELNWVNADTECSGGTRPSGGARMRFSHAFGKNQERLVLVFGIPALREGANGENMPVNLTIIREGAGKFFGTQGDSKCTIDKLSQEALEGIPKRNRRYRITVSGFCSQPARALAGDGFVLITRFDFAGRVDYSEIDKGPEDRTLARNADTTDVKAP